MAMAEWKPALGGLGERRATREKMGMRPSAKVRQARLPHPATAVLARRRGFSEPSASHVQPHSATLSHTPRDLSCLTVLRNLSSAFSRQPYEAPCDGMTPGSTGQHAVVGSLKSRSSHWHVGRLLSFLRPHPQMAFAPRHWQHTGVWSSGLLPLPPALFVLADINHVAPALLPQTSLTLTNHVPVHSRVFGAHCALTGLRCRQPHPR